MTTQRRFGLRLLGLLAAAAAGAAARAWVGASLRRPFLYPTDVDLSAHELAGAPAHPRPVVFLGSCELSESALTDRFARLAGRPAYNLSTPSGHFLTELAYGRLALAHHPALVVLEMSAGDLIFPMGSSLIVVARPELLDGIAGPNLAAELTTFCGPWRALWMRFRMPVPWASNPVRERFFSSLAALQRRFYGADSDWPFEVPGDPYWTWTLFGLRLSHPQVRHALAGFKRLTAREGARLVVVQAPEGPVERASDDDIALLRRDLAAAGVADLDYTDLFAGRPDLFIDDVHLSADGERLLAERLASDLAKTSSEQAAR